MGYEAPIYVSWARNNRSVIVNVPPIKRGESESARLEFRAPDPPQPVPGLLGDPGRRGSRASRRADTAEVSANLYQLTAEEHMAEGIDTLPQSLSRRST